jgi:protein gp37
VGVMAASTKIDWCVSPDGTRGRTWNWILGCDRVSEGCTNCYAITQATIRAGNPNPKIAEAFTGLTHRVDGRPDWTGRVNLLKGRLAQPLAVRKPTTWFVNSLSDVFHDQVPDEFIAEAFAVMAATPRHIYQLLTKRHGRMKALLNSEQFVAMIREKITELDGYTGKIEWPLPNLWAGVSAEDQPTAERRVHALLATPAAVRWVSDEPQLGPIDLRNLRARNGALIDALAGDVKTPDGEIYAACPGCVDWVVCGGESGPRARRMDPGWAASLRDQCQSTGRAFFLKQTGRILAGEWGCADRNGRDPDEWPESFPRKFPASTPLARLSSRTVAAIPPGGAVHAPPCQPAGGEGHPSSREGA